MCTFTAESAALALHIDNTPYLHRKKHNVFLLLARKLRRGDYNPAQAPRAFYSLAEWAAQNYCREVATNPEEVHDFPRPALCTVCKAMAADFESNIMRDCLNAMPAALSVLSAIPGGPAVALTAVRLAAGVA